MRGKVRWWSFTYMLLFAIFSSHIIDIYRGRHLSWLVIGASVATYALMTCGNAIYAMRISHRRIKPLWKILMPCFALYFLGVALASDDLRHLVSLQPAMAATIVLLGALILVPAFWANYKVAY